MGKDRRLMPFTAVSQTTIDLLNNLEAEYLAAQASDATMPGLPPGAPARLNCWCSHFDNAIKAATSVHALQKL